MFWGYQAQQNYDVQCSEVLYVHCAPFYTDNVVQSANHTAVCSIVMNCNALLYFIPICTVQYIALRWLRGTGVRYCNTVQYIVVYDKNCIAVVEGNRSLIYCRTVQYISVYDRNCIALVVGSSSAQEFNALPPSCTTIRHRPCNKNLHSTHQDPGWGEEIIFYQDFSNIGKKPPKPALCPPFHSGDRAKTLRLK